MGRGPGAGRPSGGPRQVGLIRSRTWPHPQDPQHFVRKWEERFALSNDSGRRLTSSGQHHARLLRGQPAVPKADVKQTCGGPSRPCSSSGLKEEQTEVDDQVPTLPRPKPESRPAPRAPHPFCAKPSVASTAPFKATCKDTKTASAGARLHGITCSSFRAVSRESSSKVRKMAPSYDS